MQKQAEHDILEKENNLFNPIDVFTRCQNTFIEINGQLKQLDKTIASFNVEVTRMIMKISSSLNEASKPFMDAPFGECATNIGELQKILIPAQEDMDRNRSVRRSLDPTVTIELASLKNTISRLKDIKKKLTNESKFSVSGLQSSLAKVSAIKKKKNNEYELTNALNELEGFIERNYNGILFTTFRNSRKESADLIGSGVKEVHQVIRQMLDSMQSKFTTATTLSEKYEEKSKKALEFMSNLDVDTTSDSIVQHFSSIELSPLKYDRDTASGSIYGKDSSGIKKDSSGSRKRSLKYEVNVNGAADCSQTLPEDVEEVVNMIDVLETQTSVITPETKESINRLKSHVETLLEPHHLTLDMETIHDFEDEQPENQNTIGVKAGENVRVLSKESNGWVFVLIKRTKEKGFIPLFCLYNKHE